MREEGVDLVWVGEEALMESTQELILWAPLISRFMRSLFLVMVMQPPGAARGFCTKTGGFETAKDAAMLKPDFASETATFCFVIAEKRHPPKRFPITLGN